MTTLIPNFFLSIQSSGSQGACLLYISISFYRSSPEDWLALFRVGAVFRAAGRVGSRSRLPYVTSFCHRLRRPLADKFRRADASISGQATGAMSWAFISALKKNPQQSYVQLLNSIREELEGKYDQKPQLSCSHPLNVNLLYVM